jgi:hypothetical protein
MGMGSVNVWMTGVGAFAAARATVPPAPQPSHDWVDYTDLAIKAVAALAVVGAVILGAFLTGRQQRTAWTRDEQARRYAELHDVVSQSVASAGQPVDQALSTEQFVGLEASRTAALDTYPLVYLAVSHVFVFAGPRVVMAAPLLLQGWRDALMRACPIPGATGQAALVQRKRAHSALTMQLLALSAQMRVDLGFTGRGGARRTRDLKSEVSLQADLEAMRSSQLSDPRSTLIDWDVLRWELDSVAEASQDAGYVTDTFPWSGLTDLPPSAALKFAQPIAAMAWKLQDRKWLFAIDDSVGVMLTRSLEAQMVELVTHHGGWPDDGVAWSGAKEWHEGGAPGERYYVWFMSSFFAPPGGQAA